MAECLSDKGVTVEVKPDGSILTETPADSDIDVDALMDDCEHELNFDIPQPPRTEAEAEQWADDMLAAAECVESLGYEVKGETPSREFLIEQALSEYQDLREWDPWGAVRGASEEAQAEVFGACPEPV